jgi:homoserine dehydrogenase
MSATPRRSSRPPFAGTVRIALLGCGTVGGAVLALLRDGGERLAGRVGAPLEVRRVLVRDARRPRGCDAALVTTDAASVLDDPEIDVVVELVGGDGAAADYTLRALERGKSVVSANKLLLATRGGELLERAGRAGVDLAFEGAVGGGIPIVRTLREALAGDRVRSLAGILNGTSNYVLTRMLDDGLSMGDAVADAQRLGYAEADPSTDVDGHDAAHKLVVLTLLAFGALVPATAVPVEGIGGLEAVDHRLAARFGYRIKQLCIARDHATDLELRVHPALVPERSVLANVSGVLNGVLLEGEALGPCMLYGRGAGGGPTAVSVVGDVLDVARSIVAGVAGLQTRGIVRAHRPLRPLGAVETRYYVRFAVSDRPGVMARLAGALGAHDVSIEQLVQEARAPVEGGPANVVMMTHRAREEHVQAALAELAREPFMKAPARLLRVEEI